MTPFLHRVLPILASCALILISGAARAEPSEQPSSSSDAAPPGEYDAIPTGPVNVALPEQRSNGTHCHSS
jgi:hypothetical protein